MIINKQILHYFNDLILQNRFVLFQLRKSVLLVSSSVATATVLCLSVFAILLTTVGITLMKMIVKSVHVNLGSSAVLITNVWPKL